MGGEFNMEHIVWYYTLCCRDVSHHIHFSMRIMTFRVTNQRKKSEWICFNFLLTGKTPDESLHLNPSTYY